MALAASSGRTWVRSKTAGAWGSRSELLTGPLTTSQIAASAIRIPSEGYAAPLDTELASAAWVNGFVNSNPWGYTSAAQTITIASALTLAQGLWRAADRGAGGHPLHDGPGAVRGGRRGRYRRHL